MDPKEPAVAALKWRSDVKEKYDSMAMSFRSASDHQLGSPPRHLLSGFADYEQQFVKEVGKQNLRLLFQIASDSNAEMCWGDGGYIYFWISPEDLSRGNFDRIFTDSQGG
jgi:uncharacterized protein YwqG